jgi:hypothetical protein
LIYNRAAYNFRTRDSPHPISHPLQKKKRGEFSSPQKPTFI